MLAPSSTGWSPVANMNPARLCGAPGPLWPVWHCQLVWQCLLPTWLDKLKRCGNPEKKRGQNYFIDGNVLPYGAANWGRNLSGKLKLA